MLVPCARRCSVRTSGHRTLFAFMISKAPGDDNGWRMNSELELEILGASCNTIKTSVAPDVFISFPCESFVK